MNTETLQYDTKCPVVLPREDRVVEDLVMHVHESLMHAGMEHVRSALQEKYHIVSNGTWVKSVINKCVKPVDQKLALLPVDRLEMGVPFEVSGARLFRALFDKA